MSLLSAVLLEVDKVKCEKFKVQKDLIIPKVKELLDKVQMMSWSLQQNFVDTYVNFTTTKSLELLNYKNRKIDLLSSYDNLLEEIKPLQESPSSPDEDFHICYEKLVSAFVNFNNLCTLVEGKKVLDRANNEFGRSNYCEAIIGVREIQEKLKILKYDGNVGIALKNILGQVENQLSLYQAQLSIEWEDIFSWSEKKCYNYLTYSLSVQQSDPILLRKVLKTLYITERLNAELGTFSDFFINKLLHNVIRFNCDIFTEDHIGAIIFNIKIHLNDPNKPNYQTIFLNLTAVFEFLQSILGSEFECEKKFIEVFADSIRNKFFNKIIQDCIRNNLPSCNSSYQSYKNLAVELESFNKFLIDLKFVNADASPLNKYVNDTEGVLYNKKCDKLVSDVRSLLGESLSYGTLVAGSTLDHHNESILDLTDKDAIWDIEKPLFLPKCVISQNVKKIMTMVVEHLEESAKLPSSYSKQLISYIKDIAVMYQCIVPKKFKVNLECCPLDIALFFNNCFYLAHGLVGPPWRNILPPLLADQLVTMLVESIQDLRVLGLEKISLYLQNQKNIIITNIQPNDIPSWSHESYVQLDCAINKALNLMKDLKTSWHNILPTRMYEMSQCTLVQALCQSILQRIFSDSRPISEDLVYLIAIRLQTCVDEVGKLFEEPIDFEKKINIWTKFNKMPVLLKGQLLEIGESWNQNKELSQCYSCEEVRQIIKMRFPDNNYRLKILKEIQ